MTMPGYQTFSPPTASTGRGGMAVASVVLGVVGLPALVLCGLGLPMALVGLVLGIIAATRGPRRGTAVAGVVCSTLTLAIGGVALFFLLTKAAECGDRNVYPDDAARRQCVEREFPFAEARS